MCRKPALMLALLKQQLLFLAHDRTRQLLPRPPGIPWQGGSAGVCSYTHWPPPSLACREGRLHIDFLNAIELKASWPCHKNLFSIQAPRFCDNAGGDFSSRQGWEDTPHSGMKSKPRVKAGRHHREWHMLCHPKSSFLALMPHFCEGHLRTMNKKYLSGFSRNTLMSPSKCSSLNPRRTGSWGRVAVPGVKLILNTVLVEAVCTLVSDYTKYLKVKRPRHSFYNPTSMNCAAPKITWSIPKILQDPKTRPSVRVSS